MREIREDIANCFKEIDSNFREIDENIVSIKHSPKNIEKHYYLECEDFPSENVDQLIEETPSVTLTILRRNDKRSEKTKDELVDLARKLRSAISRPRESKDAVSGAIVSSFNVSDHPQNSDLLQVTMTIDYTLYFQLFPL